MKMSSISFRGTTPIIRSKRGLTLFSSLLAVLLTPNLRGQSWQILHGPLDGLCSAVACSADASVLYGTTDESGDLYSSTNWGGNWTFLGYGAGAMSCSADGAKLAAAGYPYVSTNYGETFLKGTNYGNAIWSSDGNLLMAFGYGVYLTTNAGLTWGTAPLKATSLSYAALSADGSVIVTANGFTLYLSTNSGKSWSSGMTLPGAGWTAVACTADGREIIAAAHGSPCTIMVSKDAGITWTNIIPYSPGMADFTNSDFISLASTADASLLVASTELFGNYEIFISRDFGQSWTDDNASSMVPAACSADGTVIVASIDAQVGIQHLAPPLAIAPTAEQLTLSWPAPSSQYTLQQASDLVSTNWVAVTNAITVTNYRNNVTVVTPVSGNVFYRLYGPN